MDKKTTVTLDRKGSVEVHGLVHGDDDAPRVAEELGLDSYYQLGLMHTGLRADGLTPETIEEVRKRAGEHGYPVSDLEKLPEAEPVVGGEVEDEISTVEVLLTHSHQPSAKEKAIYPFLILGVVALLGGIGWVVWDHNSHVYRKVMEIHQLQAVRAAADLDRGGLGALLNPDDTRYAAVQVRGWDWWRGKTAIVHGTYVRMPDIAFASIEDMVKAEKGAAALTFKVDTSVGEGNVFHVEKIDRAGMDSGMDPITLEIHPVTTGEAPPLTVRKEGEGYFDGKNIRHDRTETFRGVNRLLVEGFVQKTENGYRIVTGEFGVALASPVAPGLARMLEDLVASDEEVKALAEGPALARKELMKKRVAAFVALGGEFPWTEGGKPGRRQVTREIGEARLQGLQVGKVYVVNDVEEARPQA